MAVQDGDQRLLDRLADMPLYEIQHVVNDLTALLDRPGSITVADLLPFDQFHYLGTDALDHAATVLGLAPGVTVADVGSGLGGPARYLADRYGCVVTGFEVQAALYQLSRDLTARCEPTPSARFVHADVLALPGDVARHDHLVSLLAVLHIPQRAELFAACRRLLVPGGGLYLEDFYARRPLTDREARDLADVVACPYLPEADRYRADLAEAGFTDVVWEDVTERWLPFVTARAERFRAELPAAEARHGAGLAERLLRFYDVVRDLLAGGGVAGVRLSARAPRE